MIVSRNMREILPLIVLAQPLNALVFAADGVLQGASEFPFQARAMVLSGGDWTFLFSSPIAIGLWICAILGFIAPLFLRDILKPPAKVED